MVCQEQRGWLRWGQVKSDQFSIANGKRQGYSFYWLTGYKILDIDSLLGILKESMYIVHMGIGPVERKHRLCVLANIQLIEDMRIWVLGI